MSVATHKKKATVMSTIENQIRNSELTIFFDYRGLSVTELSGLRNNLRDSGAVLKVFKNTYSRRVLAQLNIDTPKEYLVGPTAIISSGDSITQAAKATVKFVKDFENVSVKGGVFQESAIDVKVITHLATLPSRNELIATAIRSIKSPLTNFVSGISNPLRGMINVLNSISQQKSGGK